MNTGRVVVITGAGGGVGPLLVKRFVANGDTVVATDAKAGALERLRDNLSHPGKLITETADISSEEDCRRLAESAGQLGGHVDVLINCAGFFPITPFEAISVEDWHKVLDINLTGSLLMVRAFLPLPRDPPSVRRRDAATLRKDPDHEHGRTWHNQISGRNWSGSTAVSSPCSLTAR